MVDVLAPSPPAARTVAGRTQPWRPSRAGIMARFTVIALLIAAALASPWLVPTASVNIVARVVTFAMVALSLNILLGYTGQVSLGHSAFVGVGAFSSGFAMTELNLPWVLALVFAVAIGAAAALLLGFAALRIKGYYLALVTLAYGLFAERVLFNIEAVTGGGAGMPAPRPPFAEGDIAYVYICMAFLVAVWLFDWRLTSSKAGRGIQAVRDSEKVAASWGINVTNYKLLAFVLSGCIAGLAGALFASIEQVVSNLTFSFTLSLTFLLMTVVGGVGSRAGVAVGGAIFSALAFVTGGQLIGAVMLLVVLLAFPGGIGQMLSPLVRWLTFKPARGGRRTGVTMAGGSDARP